MAIKQLLTLARRSKIHLCLNQAIRLASSAVASVSPSISPVTSSPPLTQVMPYDYAAETVKSKLKKLENPDSRFLKYASPHPKLASHDHILSSPETRITTLPNGLRVATGSNLSAKTATIGVWMTPGHVLSRNRQTALDILADMLQNSEFREARINQEREVILREMHEVEGQTQEVVLDHLYATAFQHTPLGRTILGPAQNIKSITRDDLQNFIKTHFTAPKTVIAAAGAVKHEEIVEQVKKLFTNLSSDSTSTSQLVAKEPVNFTGSEVRMINDDLPLAQFNIAFEGASWTDPDSVALMVMQTMLGSWNTSFGGGKHMGCELAQKVAINEVAEKVANKYIYEKDMAISAIAPIQELPDYNWFRTYWNRY